MAEIQSGLATLGPAGWSVTPPPSRYSGVTGVLVMAQTGLPVVLPPSGTVAVNGVITLGTALPAVYPNCWMFLPTGAVAGDATGGLYFAQMTSTTVGTVLGSKVGGALGATSAFIPSILSGQSAVVGTNSAYTQTIAADIVLSAATVPANMLGLNGSMRNELYYAVNNTAGVKLPKAFFAGNQIFNAGLGSALSGLCSTRVRNRGSLSSQVCTQLNTFGGPGATGGNLPVYATVNTGADQLMTFTAQIATATDYIVQEGLSVEVMPG